MGWPWGRKVVWGVELVGVTVWMGLVGAGLARERSVSSGGIPERFGVGLTCLGRFADSGGLA
uniref:Uncharacterized protein n=1 Tax=uncultured Oceanospirillales bacterium HF0070_21F08 TaxID=710743 RepID=E0XSG7_9GAMM|nr:hypothetical protein [uncultured Oceanospirillales bacterium HF0070_21F08]